MSYNDQKNYKSAPTGYNLLHLCGPAFQAKVLNPAITNIIAFL